MSHKFSHQSTSNQSWTKWAMLIEANAQAGVQQEIIEHKANGNSIFYEEKNKLIMETSQGERFEYKLTEQGIEILNQLADNAVIFDNSTNLGHQVKLTIETKKITQEAENLPEWLIRAVSPEQLQSIQTESTAESI